MNSQTVEVDGASLAVTVWGEAGDPVLLLHGALSTAEQNYRMVIGPLSARHRLIGLDTRGHGRSHNRNGTFSLERLRDDAVAVLDALGLEKMHVLGTSLGGYMALALRAAHPERVQTLALAGVATGWTHEHAETRRRFFQPDSVLRHYPHWKTYLAELHGHFDGPEAWRTTSAAVADLLFSLPDISAVSREALRADVDKLPLLYILGDRDEMVPLEAVVDVANDRPDAQILVVPRAGHLFREYDPTVFSAAYLAFLHRNRLPRS